MFIDVILTKQCNKQFVSQALFVCRCFPTEAIYLTCYQLVKRFTPHDCGAKITPSRAVEIPNTVFHIWKNEMAVPDRW
jgi:hypothetical protein